MLTHLECTRCGEHYPADRPQSVCPKDGGILYARYDLAAIKAAIGSAETLSITSSALRDAVGLGFNRSGIADVIQSIERQMFYKSMTTYADHRLWQDVYHVSLEAGPTLYIKFQANVVTEFTVMAFKEK